MDNSHSTASLSYLRINKLATAHHKISPLPASLTGLEQRMTQIDLGIAGQIAVRISILTIEKLSIATLCIQNYFYAHSEVVLGHEKVTSRDCVEREGVEGGGGGVEL